MAKVDGCFIIAIDGPAASGKGTLAQRLAGLLGFDYLNTGALYRAVAAKMLEKSITLDDTDAILALIKETGFSDIAALPLNSVRVSKIVSNVAAKPEVREALLEMQRGFPGSKTGVVVEGRDIGTVIFPNANVKFFITADIEVRAMRRFKQLQSNGENIIYDQVLQDLKERDLKDSIRKVAPLHVDQGYHIIDTGQLSIEESIQRICHLLKTRLNCLLT